ncbi:hypothetical protein [Paenibacillus sp. SER-28]
MLRDIVNWRAGIAIKRSSCLQETEGLETIKASALYLLPQLFSSTKSSTEIRISVIPDGTLFIVGQAIGAL